MNTFTSADTAILDFSANVTLDYPSVAGEDTGDFYGEDELDAIIVENMAQIQDAYAVFEAKEPQPQPQPQPQPEPEPVRTWLASQTEDVWFQYKEGSFCLTFKTTDPVIIGNNWNGAGLRLLYQDSMAIVAPKIAGTPTFTQKSREVDGDTITYLLKIEEITQRHQGKAFCFVFSIGDLYIATDGFLVKTKRTKRKRNPDRPDSAESEYKRKTRAVLEQLQWSIGGYTSSCAGFADFSKPIYTCTMCNGQKNQGHFTDCPIRELL
jgi:hypothetical protein